MPTYYTGKGVHIRNPDAYARTGAPMYQTKSGSTNINKETAIYKLNLQNGKKYIGKSTDVDRRMDQHFSGNGAKVTQKFKPIEGKVLDSCPGYFADDLENEYTEDYIEKNGYDNVRGGRYCNSNTLNYNKSGSKKNITCYKCGKQGHYANTCYSKKCYYDYSSSSDDY